MGNWQIQKELNKDVLIYYSTLMQMLQKQNYSSTENAVHLDLIFSFNGCECFVNVYQNKQEKSL